jgi:putative resolvase
LKLSVWAKQQGIGYKTAWRYWNTGTLPVKAVQLPSGTILVKEKAEVEKPVIRVALYARVSSSDQKSNLETQLGRLAVYANSEKWAVTNTVWEIGSGLNGHRRKLMDILSDPAISTIAVEHLDRLMRFDSEYIESALAAQGRRLVVLSPKELKDDLVQDMIHVLTSFCARLYGRRSARSKARKAMENLESPVRNN